MMYAITMGLLEEHPFLFNTLGVIENFLPITGK